MVIKKRIGAKKTLKRKTTKWYYMADTSGNIKLVGLVSAKKLTKVGKIRKKAISNTFKRKLKK